MKGFLHQLPIHVLHCFFCNTISAPVFREIASSSIIFILLVPGTMGTFYFFNWDSAALSVLLPLVKLKWLSQNFLLPPWCEQGLLMQHFSYWAEILANAHREMNVPSCCSLYFLVIVSLCAVCAVCGHMLMYSTQGRRFCLGFHSAGHFSDFQNCIKSPIVPSGQSALPAGHFLFVLDRQVFPQLGSPDFLTTGELCREEIHQYD